MNYQKFGNKPSVVNGIKFQSRLEADRYQQLLLLVKAGEICDLTLQMEFQIFKGYRDPETGEKEKSASLSSCISLLYASGSPFSTVSMPIRSPYTLPVLPRISSAISGLRFWGIMDEPVVNSLDSSTNLNSQLDHKIISSLKRDRCIIVVAQHEQTSTQ